MISSLSDMIYDKGTYIDSFKVSLLLKQFGDTVTYRVRDANGKLYILKFGPSVAEFENATHSVLFLSRSDRYIVYRYINGETLEAHLARLHKLSQEETLGLVKDILQQLNSYHQLGLAHCNLTCENVVIDLTSEKSVAYLVGLGHLQKSNRDLVKNDLNAVGLLMCRMLQGEMSGKVKIKAGKLTALETVMVRALSSEFESAEDMLKALQGNSIDSKVLKSRLGPGFSAVAGMEMLKNQLQSEVIDIIADKEEAERYGIDIPNGMLLYGPPGCGKTFIAERFAEEAGYNYRYIKTSDLASTYLHGSQEKIAGLFQEARNNAPTILCFDEFDALVPRRDDINNASQRAEVNEFLLQLNNCGKDGVFVIATSNRPDKIDSAILRAGRIDYIVYVPVPDMETRMKMFEMEITRRPHDNNIDYRLLAKQSAGYLASDISLVVQQCARIAFKQKISISNDSLLSTIKNRRPSLSKSDLAYYEHLREKFENQEECRVRKRIGFNI